MGNRGEYVRKPSFRSPPRASVPVWLTVLAILAVMLAGASALTAFLVHRRAGQPTATVTSSPADVVEARTVPGTVPCGWFFDNTLTEATKFPADLAPDSGAAHVVVDTDLGQIAFTVNRAEVPCAAASFEALAANRFYDGKPCGKASTGAAVVRCGDGRGPGYVYAAREPSIIVISETTTPPPDEFVLCKDIGKPATGPDDLCTEDGKPWPPPPTSRLRAGTVAMVGDSHNWVRSDFLLVGRDTSLVGNYPVVGVITAGMDVIQLAITGTRLTIRSVTVS